MGVLRPVGEEGAVEGVVEAKGAEADAAERVVACHVECALPVAQADAARGQQVVEQLDAHDAQGDEEGEGGGRGRDDAEEQARVLHEEALAQHGGEGGQAGSEGQPAALRKGEEQAGERGGQPKAREAQEPPPPLARPKAVEDVADEAGHHEGQEAGEAVGEQKGRVDASGRAGHQVAQELRVHPQLGRHQPRVLRDHPLRQRKIDELLEEAVEADHKGRGPEHAQEVAAARPLLARHGGHEHREGHAVGHPLEQRGQALDRVGGAEGGDGGEEEQGDGREAHPGPRQGEPLGHGGPH